MKLSMSIGGIFLIAFGAYLLGSLPTGYLVGRAKGLDIRTQGSGNIGATNVFRVLGTTAGVGVLLVDALKGALSVLWIPDVVSHLAGGASPEVGRLVAALGAVLGHNYTCWLRFKGGKGIATSAGVLAALVPTAFLVTFATFAVVLAVTRYVSLASILAAATLPIATGVTLAREPGRGQMPALVGLTTLLAVLAIWKHRPNIRRLLAGTEPRIGKRPGNPPATPSSTSP